MVHAIEMWMRTPPQIERVAIASVPCARPAKIAPVGFGDGLAEVDHAVRDDHHEDRVWPEAAAQHAEDEPTIEKLERDERRCVEQLPRDEITPAARRELVERIRRLERVRAAGEEHHGKHRRVEHRVHVQVLPQPFAGEVDVRARTRASIAAATSGTRM